MDAKIFDTNIEKAWCPGCGNFIIRNSLIQALSELEIPNNKVCLVSGIGQAAKTPQYINANYFNGLHGRSLPVATGIKLSNPELTVIVTSGDGCNYGEGGNHFIHTIRKNPDITLIVHNNMVYGLTKGQASPTSQMGFKTPVQVNGTLLEPFNPLATAIALNASFVARTFVGYREKTVDIIKQAIQHKGFALVDIFQPCVTFNKVNTFQWYKENSYWIENHDPYDQSAAFKLAIEGPPYPLGVLYINEKPTFEERMPVINKNKKPLYQQERTFDTLIEFLAQKT